MPKPSTQADFDAAIALLTVNIAGAIRSAVDNPAKAELIISNIAHYPGMDLLRNLHPVSATSGRRGGMNYLVVLEDGRFAADAKARRFATEYPHAHLFDKSSDAYHVAKMLNVSARVKAHAVSVKMYEEDDMGFEMQHPHPDARVRQAQGDATGVDDQPS
jgi:hypothetical protein